MFWNTKRASRQTRDAVGSLANLHDFVFELLQAVWRRTYRVRWCSHKESKHNIPWRVGGSQCCNATRNVALFAVNETYCDNSQRFNRKTSSPRPSPSLRLSTSMSASLFCRIRAVLDILKCCQAHRLSIVTRCDTVASHDQWVLSGPDTTLNNNTHDHQQATYAVLTDSSTRSTHSPIQRIMVSWHREVKTCRHRVFAYR